MSTPTVEIVVTDAGPQAVPGGTTPSADTSGGGGGGGRGGRGGDLIDSMLQFMGMGRNTQAGRAANAAGIDIGGMFRGFGGGGLGNMVASAAPGIAGYGAMVAIADQVGDALASAARSAGETLVKVMSGDVGGMIRGAADSVATGLTAINGPAGIVAKALLGLHDAASMVTKFFMSEAQRLGMYSADISGAQAIAEYRHIVQDVRESESLGPDLGRLVDAQSRMDEAFREIVLELKEAVLPYIIELAEFSAEVAEFVKENYSIKTFLENMATAISAIGDGMVIALPLFGQIWQAVELAWEERDAIRGLINKAHHGKHEEIGPGLLYQDLMGTIGDILNDVPPAPAPDPLR